MEEVGHLYGVLAQGAGKGAVASCAEGQAWLSDPPEILKKPMVFPFSPLPLWLVLLEVLLCLGRNRVAGWRKCRQG